MKPRTGFFVQPSEDEDSQLMTKVRDGDTRAFAKLFERYKVPILSYIRRQVRHPTVAEELAQEVFLKVYRARQSYEPKAKFSTWLWTISRNTIIDHHRASSQGWVEVPDFTDTVMDALPDEGDSPEEKLLAGVAQERLDECLEKLPARSKEILMLRVQSDLTYEELSEIVGESVANIKTLTHRARRMLTLCLERGGV